MQKNISKYLLIGMMIVSVFVGIACNQKKGDSIFLLEGNIIGLTPDYLLGGYDPETVETNLIIPFAKYLAKNKNIESIKYQIQPAYFRIFLKTNSNSDLYSQLEHLIDDLPNASDAKEYFQKSAEKELDQKIYIASSNYSGFRKDELHLLGKPLLLSLAGMTEEKLTELTPEIMSKQLLITCDRMRLAQYDLKLDDVRASISGYLLALSKGESILITQLNDIEDVKNIYLPNSAGHLVQIVDVARFEEILCGINRHWTTMSKFR
ncbi:MAG: hypothetical protein KJ915_10385 [Candidatus Omnitrophica bacterium]|nr:hypothetical protein [Candidatus Omnitrophota bacterium]